MTLSWRLAFPCLLFVALGCAPAEIRQAAPPRVTVWTQTERTVPGGVLRLRASRASLTDTVRLDVEGRRVDFLPDPGDPNLLDVLLPVAVDHPPGPMRVTVTARTPAGGEKRTTFDLYVMPSEPPKTVHLTIRGFGNYDFASESRLMREARDRASFRPHREVPLRFAWPVEGRISEVFGVKRIYNQGEGSWYHGGIDLAAPGGTPIRAPAPGRVLFAEHFDAHGKTILIDHGFKIVTTYLHQRKLHVKTGDVVDTGDVIGEVGSTGSSTGNHLHFQVNLHGVKVDPMVFLEGRLLLPIKHD